MKQFAKYSDTVTIKRGEDECVKPRNIALMMVLNDVEESSMNGGGAKEKGCAKRCKPEFLLLSDNKKDCKKIMSVFSEIFTTKENMNKKDNYDFHWFQQHEDGSIATAVNNYVNEKKKERENGRAKVIMTLDSYFSDC